MRWRVLAIITVIPSTKSVEKDVAVSILVGVQMYGWWSCWGRLRSRGRFYGRVVIVEARLCV